MNSSLNWINSQGLLSMMVIFPAPTFLLPSQDITAPTPDGEPSKEFLAFGSSFAHGDQTSHCRKLLTCGKTFSGGAAMVAERETTKSSGRPAMTTMKMMAMNARAKRMGSMDFLSFGF